MLKGRKFTKPEIEGIRCPLDSILVIHVNGNKKEYVPLAIFPNADKEKHGTLSVSEEAGIGLQIEQGKKNKFKCQ